MNKAHLRHYREQLSEQLRALLSNGDVTIGQLEEDDESPADPNDRASLESDRNFDLRLLDRDRRLILKIREALQRIEDGTFGICEDCGQPIEEKRLRARPVTSQCIECKEDQERRENRQRLPPAAEPASEPEPEPAQAAKRPRRPRG
jgi:DnaK suppressor protein